MKKIAIITAGGKGTRMGQDIPKQFLNVYEKPMILYTLEAFQKHPQIDGIIVVCIAGWEKILDGYAKQFNITKLIAIVKGGKNGQASIYNGLKEASKFYEENDMVLIHDGNRPMVSEAIITDAIKVCEKYGNAISGIPCTSVILKNKTKNSSEEAIDRDQVYLSQTPHAFILKDILSVHAEAKKLKIKDAVASCDLYIALGRKVYYSLGDETNIKLTRTGDLLIFKALLASEKEGWLK